MMLVKTRTRRIAHRVGRRRRRSGAIIIIAVIALVALLACAALSVDLGQMMMVMSRAQSLADAAALSGAGEKLVNDHTGCVQRIQAILLANAQAKYPTQFNPLDLIFYQEGSEVPGFRMLGPSEEAVRVKLSIDAPFLFARVLGLRMAKITREATALRLNDAGGHGVIFAIDSDPRHVGVDMSGVGITVDGVVHSNTGLDINGSYHYFMDAVEWVNRFRVLGGHLTFDVGDVESTVQRDPLIAYNDPAVFEPYDYEINGDYQVPSSGVVPPGVYRVHGSVHVSGSGQVLDRVTFVADGPISMSGSNHLYRPARYGFFAYSLNPGTNAVNIAGAGPNCRGTLYAPNGTVSFSSQDNIITDSSIVGMQVDMAGQYYTICPTGNIGDDGSRVRLIK